MYSSFSKAYQKDDVVNDNDNKTAEFFGERFTYDIRNKEELNNVMKEFEMVVVEGYADWCQPCKHAGKKFEELGYALQKLFEMKRVILFKDNIDLEDSPHRDKIDVVPTFFIYIRGRLVKVFTGVDFQEMTAFIQEYFKN